MVVRIDVMMSLFSDGGTFPVAGRELHRSNLEHRTEGHHSAKSGRDADVRRLAGPSRTAFPDAIRSSTTTSVAFPHISTFSSWHAETQTRWLMTSG